MLAHVFGALGLLGITAGDNQSDKKSVLISFLIANIMYGFEFFLLDAMSGFYTCFIAAIRAIVYYIYEKKNKKKPIFLLLIFWGLIIVAGMNSYIDLYSLLPIMGTLLISWGLWQSNLRAFRIVAAIDPINYFIYDFHVGAYIGIIAAVLEFVGAIIAIIRLDILKVKNETENSN